MRRHLLVLASLLAMAAPVTATTDIAAADEPPPALKLIATQPQAEIVKYPDGYTEFDLGVHAATGDEPFEIRAVRSSYDLPIELTRVTPAGNQTLPAGLAANFNGLTNFVAIRLFDSEDRRVLLHRTSFCPNGYAQRIRPDAPVDSRYPQECASNLYALGAVWGIQSGHAVPLLGGFFGFEGPAIKLPKPGKYRADIRIRRVFREALGISDADGIVSLQVKVVKGSFDDHFKARTAKDRVLPPPSAAKAGSLAVGSIPADAPKPDLRSLPAWSIGADGDHVVFAATVWNGGPSPLLVDGFRRSGEDVMDAYQYVLDENGDQVGYENVGTMEWDPREEHHHWHFQDFARYSLTDANKEEVFVSKKEAFCLANTDAVDYTVPGADWRPFNTDLSTACGEHTSLAVREVLSSGSGDTYHQFRPGQSLSLKGRPNGTYYIKVEANPSQRLAESDLTNNVSFRKIEVRGRPGNRKVTAEKVGIIDEEYFSEEFLSAFQH